MTFSYLTRVRGVVQPSNSYLTSMHGVSGVATFSYLTRARGFIAGPMQVSAGSPQLQEPFTPSYLNATILTPDQIADSYLWEQIDGLPLVDIVQDGSASASFITPATFGGTTLTFKVTASQIGTPSSGVDTVTVQVRPHPGPWYPNGLGGFTGANFTFLPPQQASHIMFGISTFTPAGQTDEQALAAQEELVSPGYRYEMFHQYRTMDAVFPNAMETARAATGQSILLTWQPTFTIGYVWVVAGVSTTITSANQAVKWKDITDGKLDSIIDAQANRIKAISPATVYLNFTNEPDNTVTTYLTPGINGTEAEFVAAWRYIHGRFDALGVTNVEWTMIFSGTNTLSKNLVAKAMYPGDAYVDWIGFNAYNWGAARGDAWKTFDQTVRPWYEWAIANLSSNKPMMLGETGTHTDAILKPAWFDQMGTALATNAFPALKAINYYNHNRAATTPGDTASGDWAVDTPVGVRSAYNKAITAIYGDPTTTPSASAVVTSPALMTSPALLTHA